MTVRLASLLRRPVVIDAVGVVGALALCAVAGMGYEPVKPAAASVPVAVTSPAVAAPPAVEVPYVRVPDCGDLPDGDGYADATCVTWDEDAYWVYTNGEGTRVAECAAEDGGPVMPCVWDPANMGNGLPDGPVLYVLNFSE